MNLEYSLLVLLCGIAGVLQFFHLKNPKPRDAEVSSAVYRLKIGAWIIALVGAFFISPSERSMSISLVFALYLLAFAEIVRTISKLQNTIDRKVIQELFDNSYLDKK